MLDGLCHVLAARPEMSLPVSSKIADAGVSAVSVVKKAEKVHKG